MFYVYEHWRPDTDECFYVGKGTGRRAFSLFPRNRHYANIVNKLHKLGLAVDVRFVRAELTEEEAFKLEAALICAKGRYPKGPLVNQTDGGEGSSGLLMSNESKELMRKIALRNGNTPPSQKGTKQSPETISKRALKLRGRVLSEEQKAMLRVASVGRVPSEETRQKMRSAKLGKKQSPETVEKRISPNRGKKRPVEWGNAISKARMGHGVSEETREKIRQKALERHQLKRDARGGNLGRTDLEP